MESMTYLSFPSIINDEMEKPPCGIILSPMQGKTSFRSFFIPSLLLFCLGWGGLVLLLFFSRPTIWPRWFFFVCWTVAWSGTALPVTCFLNLRFKSTPPAGSNVIIRQAIWVGIYASTLAWMQLGRLASIWIAASLAGGLLAVELLIRMRERSQWRPPEPRQEKLPDDNGS